MSPATRSERPRPRLAARLRGGLAAGLAGLVPSFVGVSLVGASLVGVSLVGVSLVGVGTAAAQDTRDAPREGLTIALVDAPLDPGDPRSTVYIIGHHQPGDTVERTIEVSNGTDESMDLTFAMADATADEEWTVQDGVGVSELARWTTVTPSAMTLGAGERRTVEVVVRIAQDAFGGERYGAVVAQQVPTGGTGTRFVTRVGIRTYLSVGGPVAPPTDFTIDTMQPLRLADGTPAVLVAVTNTGDRVIDVAGQLDLRDGPGSLSAGPFPVVVPQTLGPGFRGEVLVQLDASLPIGPWLAVADLVGGSERRQAQATITFPGTTAGGDSDAGGTVDGTDPGSSPDQSAPGQILFGDPVPAEPFLDRDVLVPFNLVLLGLAVLGLIAVAQGRVERLRTPGRNRTYATGSGNQDSIH